MKLWTPKDNINRNNVENNQKQESPGNQLLKDKLKSIFWETIDIFHNKNIDERTYLTRVKAGANQSNILSNITFLPCWMKCWNGLRNYKIYKVSKKKKKIMLDDVGWSLFQNKISSNMFRRKSMNFPCWTGLVGCFIQHS